MTPEPPRYEIGQIVNGHRWTGTVWEPVAAPNVQGEPTLPAYYIDEEEPRHAGHDDEYEGSHARRGGAHAIAIPVWRRWWFWLGGVVAVGAILFGGWAAARGTSGGTTVSASPSPSATPTPTETSPAPTDSEESPLSTTSSASPQVTLSDSTGSGTIEQARADLASAFGVFSTVNESGSGDAVVSLPSGVGAGIVTFMSDERKAFSIEAQDSSGGAIGDAFTGGDGTPGGSAAFGTDAGTPNPAKLNVTATGSWRITVEPIAKAPEITFPANKTGSGVYLYMGKAATWAVTHTGGGDFAVTVEGQDGTTKKVASGTGDYSGTAPAAPGPVIVRVQTDGAWTISAK